MIEHAPDSEMPRNDEQNQQINPSVAELETAVIEPDSELSQNNEQISPSTAELQTVVIEPDSALPQNDEHINPSTAELETAVIEPDSALPQNDEHINRLTADLMSTMIEQDEPHNELPENNEQINPSATIAIIGYLMLDADGNTVFTFSSEDGSVNVLGSPLYDNRTVQHQILTLQSAAADDVQMNTVTAESGVYVQQNDADDSIASTSNFQDANQLNSEVGEAGIRRQRRRGIRNIGAWKKNVRKMRKQTGKSYINSKGLQQRARSSKYRQSCANCKFKCTEKITEATCMEMHENFWAMSDDLKYSFFEQTTERAEAKRRRTEDSRKKYSLKYHFVTGEQKMRVCKKFYLSCLDISQKRVSYYHEHIRNRSTGTARHDMRGKHRKKCTPTQDREVVREHINSFPRVMSHYRRTQSSKEYLEPGLNLQKMYDLYKTFCEEKQIQPLKFNIYRTVFKTDFNISVLKPKNDRCDLCEEYNTAQKNDNVTACLSETHRQHTASKVATREERQRDRDSETPILCFDLQNVISIPRASVSNMFYKRKLSVYNLTGHLSVNRRAYCVVWHESLSGRTGNDIANALVAMLEKVVEQNSQIAEICLWADSRVPQNRKSLMSLALMHFMKQHSNVTKIVQKFCEPGHSSIQEVDNIHSQIEKKLQVTEVFSPLGVVRALLATNRKKPFEVIHMQTKNFVDYQASAKLYKFNVLPYTKVKVINYSSHTPCCLQYKTSFLEQEFAKVCVLPNCQCTADDSRQCSVRRPRNFLCLTSRPRQPTALNMDKVRDIQSMFPFMPQVDREFMKSVIGIVPDVESQRTSTETAETATRGSDAVMTRSQIRIARSNKKTGLMSSLQKNTPENCPDKPTAKIRRIATSQVQVRKRTADNSCAVITKKTKKQKKPDKPPAEARKSGISQVQVAGTVSRKRRGDNTRNVVVRKKCKN